jgi:hypothetical protein
MPKCIAEISSSSGGPPRRCGFAGRHDPNTDRRLCNHHRDEGLVTVDEAVELVERSLQPGSNAARIEAIRQQLLDREADRGALLSLWDCFGGDLVGLSPAEAAAVQAVCKAKLVETCTEKPSPLTDAFVAFNISLKPSTLQLLVPSPQVAQERADARSLLDELDLKDLGPAQRATYLTSTVLPIFNDLNRLLREARAGPVPLWEQSTLRSLNVRAAEKTKDNAYLQAAALSDQNNCAVVMAEWGLLLLPCENFVGNYLDRPAVRLPDATGLTGGGDAYQLEVLRWILSYQAFLGSSLRTTVAFAWRIRGAQELNGCATKLHAELTVGVKPTGLSLGDLQAACPPGSEELCDGNDTTLKAAEVKLLRERLVSSVKDRLADAARKPWVSFKIQIDHGVPCWLITWMLMQFFGETNIEGLDEAESYWLYDIVKKLHNSGKNAMLMSEVRNQRHVWLSILLGMGHSMADINSAGVQDCVKGTERHTHRDAQIDFTSGFGPLPWAVDAATMLEVFHSYAYELFVIGEAETAGSRKQRAVYTLARWLFVKGDGAII